MPSSFITIDVPAAGGFGGPANVSGQESDKTLVAQGPAGALVVVEGSADGVTFAPLATLGPLPNVSEKRLDLTLTHVRAKNIGAPGSVVLSVGAGETTSNQFLSLPIGDPGTSVDTSALGEKRTVIVTGSYSDSVVIEGSEDGSTFTPVATFNTEGADARVLRGTYKAMRSRILGQGSPVVIIGAGNSIVPLAADWAVGVDRFFALDYDNGNDSNLGYSDVSMSAAGAVAKKTWGGLLAILPLNGAGRGLVIAIKNRANGAVYLKSDGVTVDDLIFRGYVGYRRIHIIGTTDFSNDATDEIRSGGVTLAAGPNADGSFTCAAGGTTVTFAVDGAQTLPTATSIEGRRVRFTGNVTAALANRCSNIHSVVAGAGGSITVGFDLNAAPAIGDTFVIEHPGVAFNKVTIGLDGAAFAAEMPSSTFNGLLLRGIAATANSFRDFTVDGPGRWANISFCDDRGGTSSSIYVAGLDQVWIDSRCINQAGTVFGTRVGYGLYWSGGAHFTEIASLLLRAYGQTAPTSPSSSILLLGNIRSYLIGLGSFQYGPAKIFGCGGGTVTSTAPGVGIDATGGVARPLSFRNVSIGTEVIFLNQSSGSHRNVEFVNCTLPLVRISGLIQANLFNEFTGAGNTDVAFVVDCDNSLLSFGTLAANTVVGAAGEISLSGGMTTYAALAITNVADERGNEIVGTGGVVAGQAIVVSNQSGGALAVGDIVRSNGTSGQVTKAQADSAANASGPLLVMVTPPASAASGYAVPPGDGAWVNFDAAPAAGALSYLDDGAAGLATTTLPATAGDNQRRRLGHTLIVSGTRARLVGSPEILPVLANGTP